MVIRIFDDNRDVDGFLELYRIAYGKLMSREYFEWKYIKNPFRINIHPIIVVEVNNTLIGALGLVFGRMMINGTMIYASQIANGMVHPEFRNRGIIAEVLRFSQNLYRESQYKIVYGFPNEMSIGSDIRAGRKIIYQFASHWKILNSHKAFSILLNNSIFGIAGALFSPCLWHKTRVPEVCNQNVTVHVVNDVAILEDIYNRWKNSDKIYNIRDAEYLNWRFSSHPEKEYQFLTAYVGEEAKGYFVTSMTEIMGMKKGTIADYLVVDDDPNVFESLLNYSLKLFKDNSCALVNTWVFTQKWAQPVVEDYGFISSRNFFLRSKYPNNYLGAKPANEQNFPYDITSIEWYITPSDSDTY